MAGLTGGTIANRADTWGQPEPTRAIESANGQFVLHLVAGGLRAGTPRCEGIVFERGTNTPDRELAQFQLENLEAPVEAYITDDGLHLVALPDYLESRGREVFEVHSGQITTATISFQ